MLLRFGVSNHLSIRDRQELSLTASALKDRDEGLIHCSSAPSASVVPAIVIYGANASGKTNLVDAIDAMRTVVLESHARGQPDGGVPRSPFALDAESAALPTQLDIDFVMDGVRHHYGFEASDEAFESEWLYVFPKAHRRTLFERDGDDFHFGRMLGGPNRVISGLTRRNSLYVSAAAQYGHEQLSKIFAYFRTFRSVRAVAIAGERAWEHLGGNEPDRRVIEFLDMVGTGVVDYRKTKANIPGQVKHVHELLQAFAKQAQPRPIKIRTNIEDENRIELGHRNREGEPVYFELDRESAGTRRLLIVLDHAFRALDEGLPLCIDEIDASLHTHAAQAVVGLFCSPDTNPRGAQLVATTHDTNMMNPSVLRRDQLWFTEKDAGGATQLYPLTDIRTRKGDNFEKGYLQGRYGAVPSNDLILGHNATG